MSQLKNEGIAQRLRETLTFIYPEGIMVIGDGIIEDLETERLAFLEELKSQPLVEANTNEEPNTQTGAVVDNVISQKSSVKGSKLEDSKKTSPEDLSEDLSKYLSPDQIKSPSYAHNQDYLSVYQATGNREAFALLVEANRGLVWYIAKKYRRYRNETIDEDDLMQWGYLGLLEAVERYDASKGAKFSTYASIWIKQAVVRGIMDTASTIRIPINARAIINQLTKKEIESECLFGEIDVDWICRQLAIPEGEYLRLVNVRDSFEHLVSLDTLMKDATEEDPIEEILMDGEENIQGQLDREWAHEALEEVLDKLTDREENVLRLRYGFDDGTRRTMVHVGRIFGVNRDRIRQIEAKAKRKLAKPEIRDLLQDHYYRQGGDGRRSKKTGSDKVSPTV